MADNTIKYIKIKDLDTVSTMNDANFLLVETADGTKKLDATVIVDAINKINNIEDKVDPFKISFSISPSIAEIGTSVNVTANWSYNKTIASQTLNNESLDISIKTKTFNAITKDTTYTLKAILANGSSQTASASIKFVAASYYGIVNTLTPTATEIKALTKTVKNGKDLTYSGINLADQRTCYAYPKSFGTVSNIKDANGFDITASFTKNEITIDGIVYYVYVLTDTVSIDNGKQIFN